MGLVGNEGVLGVAAFLGGESTCSRALAAVAGDEFRLPAKLLVKEFARCGALQHLLLRYIQALITQISQTAVCNRSHQRKEGERSGRSQNLRGACSELPLGLVRVSESTRGLSLAAN